MKGLEQFGGALGGALTDYGDFLGKYILALPVDKSEKAESSATPSTPEITTPIQPETVAPVVSEEMSPESQARFDETLRMMDVIGNVPLKQEPELSAEDKAREAFESKTNNPARDAGLDPNFLFARHKANLASQLAKQGVTVEEAEANPEQAFLADQLGKYLGSRREFNSGRDRGF